MSIFVCAASAASFPCDVLTCVVNLFVCAGEYILQTTKDDGAATSGDQGKDDRPIGKQIDDGMPVSFATLERPGLHEMCTTLR